MQQNERQPWVGEVVPGFRGANTLSQQRRFRCFCSASTRNTYWDTRSCRWRRSGRTRRWSKWRSRWLKWRYPRWSERCWTQCSCGTTRFVQFAFCFTQTFIAWTKSTNTDLSRLLIDEVPRSMLRSTSPVLRPRCQRSESECRWAKRRTWTTRLVNCCTRIQRNERKLLTNPEAPEEKKGPAEVD